MNFGHLSHAYKQDHQTHQSKVCPESNSQVLNLRIGIESKSSPQLKIEL